MIRYMISISLLILSACGSGGGTSMPKTVGGSAPVIQVQLNDLWNQVFSSESVRLSDLRYFSPPSVVHAVGGAYAGGNPSQYLHARLKIDAWVCEYQANNVSSNALVLQSCAGGIVNNTQLPAGTIIELENYDAPGILLEVHFELVAH